MYNRVILVGRLTTDPELKYTPNSVAVTTFSIAVDRPFSKGGEKQTDFIDIVAWRQNAEFICRFFQKGKAILVEGSIQVRSYVDKNGQNRRVWEVVADNARFVEGKNTHNADVERPDEPPAQREDFAEIDDDGDLPFNIS